MRLYTRFYELVIGQRDEKGINPRRCGLDRGNKRQIVFDFTKLLSRVGVDCTTARGDLRVAANSVRLYLEGNARRKDTQRSEKIGICFSHLRKFDPATRNKKRGHIFSDSTLSEVPAIWVGTNSKDRRARAGYLRQLQPCRESSNWHFDSSTPGNLTFMTDLGSFTIIPSFKLAKNST